MGRSRRRRRRRRRIQPDEEPDGLTVPAEPEIVGHRVQSSESVGNVGLNREVYDLHENLLSVRGQYTILGE